MTDADEALIRRARYLRKVVDRMAYVGCTQISSPTITLFQIQVEEIEIDLFGRGIIACIGCFREWPLRNILAGTDEEQHFPRSGGGVLHCDGIPCAKEAETKEELRES